MWSSSEGLPTWSGGGADPAVLVALQGRGSTAEEDRHPNQLIGE